jgi:hypothetical protein
MVGNIVNHFCIYKIIHYLCSMKNKLKHISFTEAISNITDSDIAKNETKDCVVRSFASAFEVDYDVAHRIVAEKFKRRNREGTSLFYIRMNELMIDNFELNNKKINRVKRDVDMFYFVNVKGVKTLRSTTTLNFINSYPKGTYIVMVNGHAFTIKDGVVIGNHADAQSRKKIIRAAWQIQ